MLNRFVWWTALFICCVTSGCAMLIPGPGLDDFPLSDSSFISSPMVLQQKITVTFGEKKIALIGIAELASDRIKIAGLTDFGKRLLMIDYDGKTLIDEIEPMLAEYFTGRDILLHYQMAYWPEAALRNAISSSEWKMVSSSELREFVYQDDVIYKAEIDKVLPDGANAKVCNLAAGYCLKFENLVIDK